MASKKKGRPRPTGGPPKQTLPPLKLEAAGECRWRIPKGARPWMRAPAMVLADERLLPQIQEDLALEQLANSTALPGIVGQALAMPDCHQGYGLPVGGVVATEMEHGVVSPGGVGYDINCGVRLLTSGLNERDLLRQQAKLADALFHAIPSGVGVRDGLDVDRRDLDDLLVGGARWMIERDWGEPEDLGSIESGGALAGADPGEVSSRAKDRGLNQVATLGAGNHFAEVQVVDEVYDEEAAKAMGLAKGSVTLLIHSGSRGLGHQVCQDFLEVMADSMRANDIELPDRQLACGPIRSPEGQRYLAAMQAAANFAFANRQGMTHRARRAFADVFGRRDGALALVYDVCHNVAKAERHVIGGVEREVLVHRKGATRAFPAGHPEVPTRYRAVGQPVLIPGDMGRYSFVAVGTAIAMQDTFGSICHGAGRNMSRNEAKRVAGEADIAAELKKKGILVRTPSPRGLAEEASVAYKDVANVVDVCERAGIARKVVRLRPKVVIKG